jgi:quinol monooxygenase YgiN
MIIQHEVRDYAHWKTIFDLSYPVRKMMGERSCRVFRNYDRPNDITVLLEWKDISRASEYAESEDLRASMRQAGVLGTPRIYLTEEDMEGE